jgi:hypothetical protein
MASTSMVAPGLSLLLGIVPLSACSTADRPAERGDESHVSFLQAFESSQMPSAAGEEGVHRELILCRRDDSGRTHIYMPAAQGMDRLVYVWGEKGPAVPIFFSNQGAMLFSKYQGLVLSSELSAATIDERAWRKFQDGSKRDQSAVSERQ